MCMHIGSEIYSSYSLDDLLHKPMTPYLLNRAVDLRNGRRGDSCLKTFARTLIGEFCFVALGVAALVECVVRIQLYLIAAIPLLLSEYCFPGAFDRAVLIDLPITLILLPDLVFRCFVGFIKSPFTRGNMDMHDLSLCVLIR